MQETHDLNGWMEKLCEEKKQLTKPDIAPNEARRCVLHIANIAECIKHQVDNAIRQWSTKRQLTFFLNDKCERKHKAFQSNAAILAAKSLESTVELNGILEVATQFQRQLSWLLEEMHQPEWYEAITDQVIMQATQAELEELPTEEHPLKSTPLHTRKRIQPR